MTVLVAGLLVAGVFSPYLLPSGALTPMTGIAVWTSVLALRAMLVVSLAVTLVLYLPATQLFQLVTHWCVHAAIPFLATHLGFSGHRFGDAAMLLPGLIVAVSLISTVFALWRGARAARRWLTGCSLGTGPKDSVIVGGAGIMVAAAGIRKPKIVVSAGALATLDEDELAAGLEHERGHISRRHPYLVVFGKVLFALARPLPGSADTLRRLHFYLERDADEYAVDRTRDPLALASVICKATAGEPVGALSLAGAGGCGTAARLRLLLDRSAARPSAWAELAGRSLVIFVLALVLAGAVAAPSLARAGVSSARGATGASFCQG